MDLAELENLIRDGEGQFVEYKETTGQRVEACRTLCAFLNGCGGTVIFGVTKKGKVTGQIVSDETKRTLADAFYDFEPGTDIPVEYVDVDETHKAIVCRVSSGVRRPYVYDGKPYKRVESTTIKMPQEEYEEMLRHRAPWPEDWSAQPVEGANLDDLDTEAVNKAREGFYEKNAIRYTRGEVFGWDLKTFLDRARLTLKGVITRTTMLLVGKELSAHLLSPHPAQIVWKLVGEEQANEIFYPPFLLATNSVYSRIRNVQIRILPDGELFQKEVPKYVPKSILEALHNCIAHQDYRRCARILVTEYVDRVQFESQGCFFEGKPEEYIAGNKTPSHYRNLQLVQAMREINMIDTQGYGIHRLYEEQRKRYFPMPDYELNGDSVKTTIYGHVVDVAYSSLLIRRTDLKLDDVCLLDRIQKNLPVDAQAVAHLRKAGLIEGRFPHLHISAKIAAATDQKAAYMRKKELSGKQYRKLITDYLAQFESLTRKEIDDYMLDEIRGELSESEKKSKISNLLTYLRRKGDIVNVGSDAYPLWKLTDKIECQ